MPVHFDNSDEGLFKLLVGKSIAKRVDRTVEVTEPVGYVIEYGVDGDIEAYEHGEDMPGGPTQHKSTQDDSDSPQGFSGPVFTFTFLVFRLSALSPSR